MATREAVNNKTIEIRPNKGINPFPILFLILVSLCAVWGYNEVKVREDNSILTMSIIDGKDIGTQYSHAIEEHQYDAIRAQNCFDKYGHAQIWYNWFRDNWLYVCQDETGQVFLKVVKKLFGRLEELTKYPKDMVFNLEDIEKILIDQGSELKWIKP